MYPLIQNQHLQQEQAKALFQDEAYVSEHQNEIAQLQVDPRLKLTFYRLDQNGQQALSSRLGLWFEGECAWMEAPEWDLYPGYYQKEFVQMSLAYHRLWDVQLTLFDRSYLKGEGVIRNLFIKNQSNAERKVRLVFQQKPMIAVENDEMIFYSPQAKALSHYHDQGYTLVSGKSRDGEALHFAAGKSEAIWNESKGRLMLAPIATETLDSMFTIHFTLPAWSEAAAQMWMLRHSSLAILQQQHQQLLN